MDNIINNKFLKKIVQQKERYIIYVLGAIILFTLAIRYAEPVRDGDFFWHVKYGEYLMENRTIVPDHSLYSWTPTNNKAIKCNWIADIILYLMNKTGGLPLLFAFRYLCLLTTILIIWTYARRMSRGKDIFTFLILLIVLLASYNSACLKPEIFSLIFMAITAGIYFSVKSSFWGKWKTRPFLIFPVIFLLWVNIHEVFIFGLVILVLVTLGEMLNYRFSRSSALTKNGMRNLLTGCILSMSASFITPYGYNIHLKYYTKLFHIKQNSGLETVEAYHNIFNKGYYLLHLVDLWLLMLIPFVFLYSLTVWKKKEWDWGILLPTIFLILISSMYIRAAYYWPAFWAMSIIYMQREIGPYWDDIARKTRALFKPAFKSGIIILFLFLSFRAINEARFRPFSRMWFGFGTGYQSPLQASEFLKANHPGSLLYNSYDTGGYLIYDLFPLYKVFIDPRYFPYKDWYDEYLNFNRGSISLIEFSKKYPFDVAVIDYLSSKNTINKFLLSQEWKPVFYGPCAIVFAKKDISSGYNLRLLDKTRFDDLHNLHQAYEVFNIAQQLGDLETSGHILQIIKSKFTKMYNYKNVHRECSFCQDGLLALADNDYDKALINLANAGYRPFSATTNRVLTKLLNWKAKQYVQNREYYKALSLIKTMVRIYPDYVNGLYNAGILGYWIRNKERNKKNVNGSEYPGSESDSLGNNTSNWRNYLERFLLLVPDHPQARIAGRILEGKEPPSKIPLILEPIFEPNNTCNSSQSSESRNN